MLKFDNEILVHFFKTPGDEIPEEGDIEEILEDDDNEMFDGEGQLPNDGWFEDHNLTTGDIIQ